MSNLYYLQRKLKLELPRIIYEFEKVVFDFLKIVTARFYSRRLVVPHKLLLWLEHGVLIGSAT